MKASRTNELRSIVVALALLFGGARALAQSPVAAPPGVAQSPSPAAPHPASNPANVVAVRIVTQDGKVLANAPANVSVQIGKPLDPSEVAESIRKLYRTGDYPDLKVIVTAVEGGV